VVMRLEGFEPPTDGFEGRRSSSELQAPGYRVVPWRRFRRLAQDVRALLARPSAMTGRAIPNTQRNSC
jgi:hypothetical protein